jgi:hypothetical protein
MRTVAEVVKQIRCPLGEPNVHQHVNISPPLPGSPIQSTPLHNLK